jgi:gliding motility-associated-like protein
MKKITLLCMATLFYTFSYSQVLNQPANWPNTNWSVTGTYNTDPGAFEADPTLTANFAFDDDDAGGTSDDTIAAESPIIDLSAAFTAAETWLIASVDYTYNDLGDTLILEYWDADAAAWVTWQQFLATADQPNDNFCTGTRDSFTSDPLDIAGFTATQQSGFRYRISFDDAAGWQWGFCFDSPTVISSPPPTCLDVSNLTSANITAATADISWTAGSTETAWEVAVQTAGTGVPTGSGTATTTNAPYTATALSAATAYEVYVRADCGVDGFSNWIGPINFTTLNLPPPPPVGVTCASGTSSFVFTEDFETDPPSGWTGTGFAGSNGNWDITAGGANSFGTGPSASFSGGMHLEYEASGNSTAIASAISPAIDLTSALDGAELSFNMHAFGADMGTLNVNVGTSATGPFTNVYTWIGDLQTADTEAWVPVGINLDAYLGQNIYIEFSYGGAGTGFEGDMSIDLMRVESCGAFCIAPSGLTASNITATTADVAWTANNGETQWEIVVQPAGTGVPTGVGTVTTTNAPYPATGLTPSTDYEVYVRANCGANGLSNWIGPINFRTLNAPPPPPVGVTCAAGTPSFVFTEDFETDPPSGWTGTGFAGTNGNWDITAGGANSIGTGPSASFSGGMHLEYEASGNSTTIASAISPAIDLTTAVDGAELSFYMHAFGADIGTLNVNVGTSATGPFTNLFNWSADLQTTDTEAWVPVGVNLDAYLGQVIYIEFSYGGAGAGFEGDLSIDLMRVETCGSFCIAPSGLTVSNVAGSTADLAWTANNGETQWEYVIIPAGTGPPTGAGTAATTTTINATGLATQTSYDVYVRAICGPGDESVWSGPVNFTTTIQTNFVVDCNVGPTNTTYCYENNDTTAFTYTSSDGVSTLAVSFNSGDVENTWDELVIIDSDGTTVLYTGYGNAGDLAGLLFQSSGPSITVQITSDFTVSCQSSANIDPWNFDVACIDPTAPPTCVSLLSPVDGAVDIEINQPITWSAAIGTPAGYIVSVGTTPGGTDVVNGVDVGNVLTLPLTTMYATTYYVTILGYNGNGLATGCTEESFTTRPDPNQVFNLVCANGAINVNHCYTNNDDNTFLFTSDTGFPIILTFASGTIVDDDDIINFYSGSDNTGDLIFTGNNAGDLSGLTVTSSGGNLFMEIISDGFQSCANGNGTQWQWTAECSTCFKPTASYTVIPDCAAGDQFLVDVEILTTGDAMSITITDDFGSAPQVVTAAGVYTFGPFPNATPVVFTVADTDDINCVLTSDPKTQAFCPDQECSIINAGYDQLQTCDLDSTDLSATFMASSITSNTSTYTISDLQCPPDNLTGTPTSITLDDRYSSLIPLTFNFDYFGTTYTDVVIGANGLISFNAGDAGNFCPWNFAPGDLLPTPAVPTNAIHGAYHDIDPGVAGNHYIEYAVVGTAPSRQFKVTFFEVPHFGCNNIMTTQQIILYESSNVIDVILIEKPVCPTWNDGGIAIVGIQNNAGTVGYAPPGRNNGVWTVTNQELWRFVPAGNPNYTFEWFDDDGNSLGNNTDITVTPTEDTTYTASISYALADGTLVTLTDDVTVRVQRDPIIVSTETLEVCDDDLDGFADFDLTVQDANIIDTQTGVTVSYYETMADAEAGTNMLADPTVYTSAGGTVYVRLQDDVTGCYATGDFEVVVLMQIDPANIGLEGECINDEYTITVSPLNNGYDPATVTYDWSGGASTNTSGSQFVATEDGEYTVTITTADGCSSMQTFTVINAMCSFPQGISPNGDGLNDSWDLRAFRVQELEIFNSHGRSIYQKMKYTNEWVGQTNDNDNLPVGTYFYVLRLENGAAKNGWIYLNR